MQNCNVVYITGEWCSKQKEWSFCYCWNLFVCNTAIAFFFFSLPFKFVGAVFNKIVNNMFVFILCASVFLLWFSILIFALIIYIIIIFFCWKSSFFYAMYKNDGRIKKYLSNRSFFLYLQISLELEKVYKKNSYFLLY
jgi:small-conductance mechanosensitive channel